MPRLNERERVSDGNWRLRPDDRFASQIYRDSGRPPAASSEVAAPKRRSSLKGLGRSLQFPSSEKNENWGRFLDDFRTFCSTHEAEVRLHIFDLIPALVASRSDLP